MFYKAASRRPHAEIVPRLRGIKGHSGRYEVLGRQEVAVRWTLGDGSKLTLLTNLSASSSKISAAIEGRCLWQEGRARERRSVRGPSSSASRRCRTPWRLTEPRNRSRARPTGCSSDKDFGFNDAAALAPYLAALGVSHVYASPYLKARPGSTHGYDIVDHNALNPELGGEAASSGWSRPFESTGLGRFSTSCRTTWASAAPTIRFGSTCSSGETNSEFADWFDIEWEPDRRYLQEKLLVPFLGDQYGAVLESGALSSGSMPKRRQLRRLGLRYSQAPDLPAPLCV